MLPPPPTHQGQVSPLSVLHMHEKLVGGADTKPWINRKLPTNMLWQYCATLLHYLAPTCTSLCVRHQIDLRQRLSRQRCVHEVFRNQNLVKHITM